MKENAHKYLLFRYSLASITISPYRKKLYNCYASNKLISTCEQHACMKGTKKCLAQENKQHMYL